MGNGKQKTVKTDSGNGKQETRCRSTESWKSVHDGYQMGFRRAPEGYLKDMTLLLTGQF
jgi:hypothetical protein